MATIAIPSSSGAVGAKSRRKRSTCGACSSGQKIGPPSTIGPTGCRSYSKVVATPKLPPPPRRPHNRSGSLAGVDVQPFAVGGDQLGRAQVVHGQPVPAHQVPEPAAQRDPADAGVS